LKCRAVKGLAGSEHSSEWRQDGNLTLALSQGPGGYSGVFTLGQKQYPATASQTGNKIDGKYTAGAGNYDFTATLTEEGLGQR
jgi:hypothetical protein